MVRIRHAPGVTGTFTDDEHGTFAIEDGFIECGDAETATALVDRHRRLSWADGPPESDATPGVDAPETGSQDGDSETCEEIVQSTGEVCGRDLPCPYHSED